MREQLLLLVSLLTSKLISLSFFSIVLSHGFQSKQTTTKHHHHNNNNNIPRSLLFVSSSSSSEADDEYSTTSMDFAMDPTGPQAKEIIKHLGLTVEQHQQLASLAVLVNDWNKRLNLISRRDCCKEVVFGRHIIPSLAPKGLDSDTTTIIQDNQKVVDVGTGGGFPGLVSVTFFVFCRMHEIYIVLYILMSKIHIFFFVLLSFFSFFLAALGYCLPQCRLFTR